MEINLIPTEIERQIFSDCAADIVAKIAASNYGKFGNLTHEAAKLMQQVAVIENCSPTLLATTWLNESTFRFNPPPNTNGKPEEFVHWDVGPMQLNVHWTRRSLEIKETKPLDDDGNWSGSQLFLPDGQPANFDGDAVANMRMAARRLVAPHSRLFAELGYASAEEFHACVYTGPGARPARLLSYRSYAPLFQKFFECYG